jgi:aryl-alcohol dehydrogenase-like predicted oxidoreductase
LRRTQRGAAPPPGRGLGQNPQETDPHFTDAAFQVLEVVRALAREKRATPSQLALAWVAQQPGVTRAIIGPCTRAQFEDCAGAMDVQLTAEDRARLDAAAPPGQMIVPYYEADFGPHRFRW